MDAAQSADIIQRCSILCPDMAGGNACSRADMACPYEHPKIAPKLAREIYLANIVMNVCHTAHTSASEFDRCRHLHFDQTRPCDGPVH